MSKGQSTSNVHVLKPRTTSVLDRLDRFLEENALAPSEKPIRRDPTRPKAPGINAIRCASCGQAEYLTRDYCRCGHYLRGQLEDEFLAWEDCLKRASEDIAETTEQKLKALRLTSLVSMPFIVAPLLYFVFSGSEFTIYAIASITIGLMILGVMAITEVHICKPLRASNALLESCTWQRFLEFRSWPRNISENLD